MKLDSSPIRFVAVVGATVFAVGLVGVAALIVTLVGLL